MLTQKDLNEIREIVQEEIGEEIKDLPSKDELYTKLDALMGEVKATREEQTLTGGRLSEHTDQLEDHESRIMKLEQTPSSR